MQSTQVKSEQIRFAQKYDYARAVDYFNRFNRSPRKRLLNWLEQCMAKRGLKMANYPNHILDIPSGTGRFWQTLHHHPEVILHAADFNSAMIDVGFEKRPIILTQNMRGTIASAFNLPFADNSFDSIFCLRFIHHINLSEDRIQLLRELARVTSNTVCISSWVAETGVKAKSRLKKETARKDNSYDKFVHSHSQLTQEFIQAGFDIVGFTDLLPHFTPWRLYVLRKKQPMTQAKTTTLNYICPLCKTPLTHDTQQKQFICHHDKLAFPMHGNFPMLTQRDALEIT